MIHFYKNIYITTGSNLYRKSDRNLIIYNNDTLIKKGIVKNFIVSNETVKLENIYNNMNDAIETNGSLISIINGHIRKNKKLLMSMDKSSFIESMVYLWSSMFKNKDIDLFYELYKKTENSVYYKLTQLKNVDIVSEKISDIINTKHSIFSKGEFENIVRKASHEKEELIINTNDVSLEYHLGNYLSGNEEHLDTLYEKVFKILAEDCFKLLTKSIIDEITECSFKKAHLTDDFLDRSILDYYKKTPLEYLDIPEIMSRGITRSTLEVFNELLIDTKFKNIINKDKKDGESSDVRALIVLEELLNKKEKELIDYFVNDGFESFIMLLRSGNHNEKINIPFLVWLNKLHITKNKDLLSKLSLK